MRGLMYPTTFANHTSLSLASERALSMRVPDFFMDKYKRDLWAG